MVWLRKYQSLNSISHQTKTVCKDNLCGNLLDEELLLLYTSLFSWVRSSYNRYTKKISVIELYCLHVSVILGNLFRTLYSIHRSRFSFCFPFLGNIFYQLILGSQITELKYITFYITEPRKADIDCMSLGQSSTIILEPLI